MMAHSQASLQVGAKSRVTTLTLISLVAAKSTALSSKMDTKQQAAAAKKQELQAVALQWSHLANALTMSQALTKVTSHYGNAHVKSNALQGHLVSTFSPEIIVAKRTYSCGAAVLLTVIAFVEYAPRFLSPIRNITVVS